MRIQLSKEWVSGTVSLMVITTASRLVPLEKIYEHRDSASHKQVKQAAEIRQEASGDKLKTVIVSNQKHYLESTCKVFRSVYYIVKNNRPFLDHADLIELQELNGVDVGLIIKKLPFSILIDESISLSKKSCMIVYMQCVSDNFEPVTIFLALLKLSGLTADDFNKA